VREGPWRSLRSKAPCLAARACRHVGHVPVCSNCGEFYVSYNRALVHWLGADHVTCRCRYRKFQQIFVAIADRSRATYLRRDAGRLIRLPFVEGSGGAFLPLFCSLLEIYISPATRGFRKACWHCCQTGVADKASLQGDPDYTTHSFAMSCRPIRSCAAVMHTKTHVLSTEELGFPVSFRF
jgi:hypothetical protein